MNKKTVILIGIIVMLVGLGSYTYMNLSAKRKAIAITNSTKTEDLSSLSENLSKLYANKIPLDVLNSRQAYKFFPLQIGEFTLLNDEVSVNVDNAYNPIKKIDVSNQFSVPVKESYVALYGIPDLLREEFSLDEYEIASPIYLTVYEFNRELSVEELTYLENNNIVNCRNEKEEISTKMYHDELFILYHCDTNATEAQLKTIKKELVFDDFYAIYLKQRNILIRMNFKSNFVDNPLNYIEDYLNKLLINNDELFINQAQIETAEDRRNFEEWRRETFDR